MALFGRSTENLLAEGFYRYAFEQGHIDELLCLEAGAKKSEILRETDYMISSHSKPKKGIEFKDSDGFYAGAFVYLPGRFVWFNENITGGNLARVFEKDELNKINKDNFVDAIASKWDQIINYPDKCIALYSPSFIYYDQIENVRLMRDYDSGKSEIRIRMLSGFTYETTIRASTPIDGVRADLVDRDDIRFLNARIAEANMRKK